MRRSLFAFLVSLASRPLFAGAAADSDWIHEYIATVPDFPKPGIQFKCYPDLLKSPEAFRRAIQQLAQRYRNYRLDAIAGLDSRGFIFGSALAYEMNLPFVMVRKAGKLPRKTERIDYQLEYGTATLEVEVESIRPNDRILIVDDLLATGGTAAAAGALIERLGGEVVEVACLIELEGLNGRENLKYPFFALVSLEN
jgi:adenine phosphoribosyltransferase